MYFSLSCFVDLILPTRDLIARPITLDSRSLFSCVTNGTDPPVLIKSVFNSALSLEDHVDKYCQRTSRYRRFMIEGVIPNVRGLFELRADLFRGVPMVISFCYALRVCVDGTRAQGTSLCHFHVTSNGSNCIVTFLSDRLRNVTVFCVGNAREITVQVRQSCVAKRGAICVGSGDLCLARVVVSAARIIPPCMYFS